MKRILESAENYLETILILKKKLGDVRSVDIANYLAFSKPSVSTAIKALREDELISVAENGFITLTKKGMEIAKAIYDRHKILTDMLISLGVSEKTAVEDACKIEHYLSEESFEKIKKHSMK